MSSREALRPHGKLQRRMSVGLIGLTVVQGHWLVANESVSPQVSHRRQNTAKPAKTAARRCSTGDVAKRVTNMRTSRPLEEPGAREGCLSKDQGWGVPVFKNIQSGHLRPSALKTKMAFQWQQYKGGWGQCC